MSLILKSDQTLQSLENNSLSHSHLIFLFIFIFVSKISWSYLCTVTTTYITCVVLYCKRKKRMIHLVFWLVESWNLVICGCCCGSFSVRLEIMSRWLIDLRIKRSVWLTWSLCSSLQSNSLTTFIKWGHLSQPRVWSIDSILIKSYS